MTFQQRLKPAVEHERRVQAELEKRGWSVVPYGMGEFPEPIQNALARVPARSLLRDLPDMLAAKDDLVRFVECKTSPGRDKYGHNTVQYDCWTGYLSWQRLTGITVYIVWDDLLLSVQRADEMDVSARLDGSGAAGSRTDFLKVPANTWLARTFDEVFGAQS